MERRVRGGTLDTNSSTVHSLSIVCENEYNEWRNGNLYYEMWSDEMITKEEVIQRIGEQEEGLETLSEEEFNELISEHDYYTFDKYLEYTEEYNDYTSHHTTKSGEKIVIFGYYGYS